MSGISKRSGEGCRLEALAPAPVFPCRLSFRRPLEDAQTEKLSHSVPPAKVDSMRVGGSL